jgi:hypothetical protein
VYDDVPQKFRTQVTVIFGNLAGQGWDSAGSILSLDLWRRVMIELAIKDGVDPKPGNAPASCLTVLWDEGIVVLLDLIEITLRFTRDIYQGALVTEFVLHSCPRFGLQEAVSRLNECFASNDMGYRIEPQSMEIHRLDSDLIHAEVVEPAFNLLRRAGYDRATEHFRNAHRFHRTGYTPNAIAEASNALESVLKEICDANGWKRDKKAAARELILLVLQEGLIPAYNESQLVGFDNLLLALPTIRNKEPGAGHGAEPNAPDTEDYLAGYAINLAAANIVMLVEAQEAYKSRK